MTSLQLKFVGTSKDSKQSDLSRLHTRVIGILSTAYPDLSPKLSHLASYDCITVPGVTELSQDVLQDLQKHIRGLQFTFQEETLKLYIHRRQRSVCASCTVGVAYIVFGAALIATSAFVKTL